MICNKTGGNCFQGAVFSYDVTNVRMFQARIVSVTLCYSVTKVPSITDIDKLPVLLYNKIGGLI